MQAHKDLEVWKKGIELVTEIYKVTKQFPKTETYGLCSQMQRAAISYPSNIAEGAARNTNNDYVRFLYVSLGSLSELETQLIISKELGYLAEVKSTISKIELLRKMTLSLIKHLKQ